MICWLVLVPILLFVAYVAAVLGAVAWAVSGDA